jgi:hypothetical protein
MSEAVGQRQGIARLETVHLMQQAAGRAWRQGTEGVFTRFFNGRKVARKTSVPCDSEPEDFPADYMEARAGAARTQERAPWFLKMTTFCSRRGR